MLPWAVHLDPTLGTCSSLGRQNLKVPLGRDPRSEDRSHLRSRPSRPLSLTADVSLRGQPLLPPSVSRTVTSLAATACWYSFWWTALAVFSDLMNSLCCHLFWWTAYAATRSDEQLMLPLVLMNSFRCHSFWWTAFAATRSDEQLSLPLALMNSFRCLSFWWTAFAVFTYCVDSPCCYLSPVNSCCCSHWCSVEQPLLFSRTVWTALAVATDVAGS